MTISLQGCSFGQVCMIYPWMNPTFYTWTLWNYDKVCCGQYTANVGGGEDPGCQQSQYLHIDVPCTPTGLSFQDIDENSKLIYPNPLSDKGILEFDGPNTIEISDLFGKVVHVISGATREIDLSDLRKGIYIFSEYSDKRILITRQKVIRD